jgi:hypothetical protein
MTSIVVATRSGLAEGPDGSKYRLARGRTFGDARHPLVKAHPDLFAPYDIELSVDEPDADEMDDGTPVALRASLQFAAEEAQATAEGYRAQLAAIAEGLHDRGLVPADVDTTREGWLAELIFATLDASPPAADDVSRDAGAPELPNPPARKRAPRRAAAPRTGGDDAED